MAKNRQYTLLSHYYFGSRFSFLRWKKAYSDFLLNLSFTFQCTSISCLPQFFWVSCYFPWASSLHNFVFHFIFSNDCRQINTKVITPTNHNTDEQTAQWTNQNSLKREKNGFGFASHRLRNWHETSKLRLVIKNHGRTAGPLGANNCKGVIPVSKFTF